MLSTNPAADARLALLADPGLELVHVGLGFRYLAGQQITLRLRHEQSGRLSHRELANLDAQVTGTALHAPLAAAWRELAGKNSGR